MFVDFDTVFHKEPYPKHLASNCPCNTCEWGMGVYTSNAYSTPQKECLKCTKCVTWTLDCVKKLRQMEEKFEEDS